MRCCWGKSKSQSLNVAQAIIKNQLRYVIAKHVAIKINVIVSQYTLGPGLWIIVPRWLGGGGAASLRMWLRVLGVSDSPLDSCNCFVGGLLLCGCRADFDIPAEVQQRFKWIWETYENSMRCQDNQCKESIVSVLKITLPSDWTCF